MFITKDILYAGVNDHQVDLFEGQYTVPNGMAYNSYVILDDKIAVMDTVDRHFQHEWLDNLALILGGRKPDYLVVQHMEPDHSANIASFLSAYPEAAGGGQRQDLRHDRPVLRPWPVRKQGGGEGRRVPFTGQTYPDLRVRAHGALARGHGHLRQHG